MNSFYNNRPNGYLETIEKGLSGEQVLIKKRLFYTQGDYGLFQSVHGRDGKTYDNEEWVMKAMAAQRFQQDENGVF